MRELDGSDAGGQFLRTALAIAAIENESVRVENVRGGRSPPGLRPQHLAVVETLGAVCDAEVSGAELGSETVTFEPGVADGVAGGEYAVDVGTAGSVTLLFDALCPLATRLDGPLTVTAGGGTDVAWSPPLDSTRYVTLPLLRRHGLQATVEVDRRGFYPDGGGRATLRLAPSDLEPIELDERAPGAVDAIRLYSTEAAALADRRVARRQAAGALRRLGVGAVDVEGAVDAGEPELERFPTELDVAGQAADVDGFTLEVVERVETAAASDCPGSAIVVRLEGSGVLAGFDALGEPGTPAERVGEEAADDAVGFLRGSSPVDRHLADQLLVHLALAGGRLRVPRVTDHVETTLSLLDSFGYGIELEDSTVRAAGPEGRG